MKSVSGFMTVNIIISDEHIIKYSWSISWVETKHEDNDLCYSISVSQGQWMQDQYAVFYKNDRGA